MHFSDPTDIETIDSALRNHHQCKLIVHDTNEVTAYEYVALSTQEGIQGNDNYRDSDPTLLWIPTFATSEAIAAWVQSLDKIPKVPSDSFFRFVEHYNQEVAGTLQLEDIDDAPEECRYLDGTPATEAQLRASLDPKAGDTGIFLVDNDGDPVAPGSWDEQNLPTARAWVDIEMDRDKARRLLDLVPNVVTISPGEALDGGGSVFDGVEPETEAEIKRLELTDALLDELETKHCKTWKAALILDGFRPYKVSPDNVGTEIARNALDPTAIVDWADHESRDPYWQWAWDYVDPEEIAKGLMERTTAWICVWVPEHQEYPRNGAGRWMRTHPVDRDPDDPTSLNVGDGSWLADYCRENAELAEGPHGEPDANLYAICVGSDDTEIAMFDAVTGELTIGNDNTAKETKPRQ